jgi:hypothetical protein
MSESPGPRRPKPAHPTWPALGLLVAVCLLLFGLATMSTIGWL